MFDPKTFQRWKNVLSTVQCLLHLESFGTDELALLTVVARLDSLLPCCQHEWNRKQTGLP